MAACSAGIPPCRHLSVAGYAHGSSFGSSWSARLATYSIGTDSSYSPAPHGREGAAREALPVEVPAATYCVGWSLLMIRYQASHGGYGAT